MDVRHVGLFQMGEELGYATVESELAFADALKLCRTPADRLALRSGFVSAYSAARKVPEASAIQAFNRRAKVHAPGTSRKHKANAKKGAGRPETKGGKAEQLNALAIAQRLAAVLHYVAKAQAEHAGDEDILNLLGEIAAICGGAKKAKRK
jgi:hypothetical protein